MKNITEYVRNCPKCGRKIYHTTNGILKQSIKENRICKSCCKKSTNNHNFGNHLSNETKNKLSKSCSVDRIKRYSIKENRDKQSKAIIKRYTNIEERNKTSLLVKEAMHRPDIRKRHLDALHHSKWIKVRTDRGQLELIEKWNKLGFNFQPNYQLKTDLDLFYVDGYDKEKNVVLEYDAKYHNKLLQRKKDLIRQNKIIELLKPKKFWRFNSVNKTCKNVLGE